MTCRAHWMRKGEREMDCRVYGVPLTTRYSPRETSCMMQTHWWPVLMLVISSFSNRCHFNEGELWTLSSLSQPLYLSLFWTSDGPSDSFTVLPEVLLDNLCDDEEVWGFEWNHSEKWPDNAAFWASYVRQKASASTPADMRRPATYWWLHILVFNFFFSFFWFCLLISFVVKTWLCIMTWWTQDCGWFLPCGHSCVLVSMRSKWMKRRGQKMRDSERLTMAGIFHEQFLCACTYGSGAQPSLCMYSLVLLVTGSQTCDRPQYEP